jgi:hypothetical protein
MIGTILPLLLIELLKQSVGNYSLEASVCKGVATKPNREGVGVSGVVKFP